MNNCTREDKKSKHRIGDKLSVHSDLYFLLNEENETTGIELLLLNNQ
jgi:hypothetical protein